MNRARYEHLLTRSASRRLLLGASFAVGATAISLPSAPTRAAGIPKASLLIRRPQFIDTPFSLGVASGDPLPESVVLWTRLAPDPVNGGGLGEASVEVRWEVANDDQFTSIVQFGTAIASPDLAHSVHVDLTGLKPGTEYFYRFGAGNEVSPTGRTKTAAATGAPLSKLRFAASSCANYEHGYFSPYRHLANEEIDFAICLGDYSYEYGMNGEFKNGSTGPVRNVTGSETISLEDYRNRHALYKTDPDLQAAHAAHPWLVIWDDHEVENDYAGANSEQSDPVEAFLARRAAAYQAYYEHMPLRADSMPIGPDMRIYRRLAFGDLAEINLLDTRQYRTDQTCGFVAPPCDEGLDPAATLTGPEQESWLFDGLADSTARWNVIAQQVMMARLDGDVSKEGQLVSHDQWDGYPLARQRLLDHLQSTGVSNPVVLTGDVHTSWVADLKLSFDDQDSPTIATEFVSTSVTSFNPIAAQLVLALPTNPHFRYYDPRHGYIRCELTPEIWQTDFRAVQRVDVPDDEIQTIASFVVENGIAGAVKA